MEDYEFEILKKNLIPIFSLEVIFIFFWKFIQTHTRVLDTFDEKLQVSSQITFRVGNQNFVWWKSHSKHISYHSIFISSEKCLKKFYE